MNSKTIQTLLLFRVPLIVLFGIILSLITQHVLHADLATSVLLIAVIFIGSLQLIRDTFNSLIAKKFALDYIAILAISVGLLTHQYLVAAIIVLMLSGGNTLEEYGMTRAKQSLTALVDRIPDSLYLWEDNQLGKNIKIEEAKVGDMIAIRKGEVIPLDGILVSKHGLADESTLTGEPYEMEKVSGDAVRSGTVNIGDLMIIKVLKEEKDSTYRRIVEMVREAQKKKAPLIRLADQYSTIFTIATLTIATLAYLLSHDFSRVLAVLVIATPCPLILATPIALIGGMSAAAKKRVIVKNIASVEVLSKITTAIFDKTGTITIGRPSVHDVKIVNETYDQKKLYSIAEAIERNSLHPLAKAICSKARELNVPHIKATDVKEVIGEGISGTVNKTRYTLRKIEDYHTIAIQLLVDKKQIAVFEFEDKIKEDSKHILQKLSKLGLDLYVFTGDRKESAKKTVDQLQIPITVKAELKPEQKKLGVEQLKKQNQIIAMVGDGINDAPALAMADVGMVFSNEEHTAASEAADIVFLGGDFEAVAQVILIARRTIQIAMQSILFGIGLSTAGMIFAAFGVVPAIIGAFLQEVIDVAVIFNALRTSQS